MITETELEEKYCLPWFQSLGWDVIHEIDIAPDSANPERDSYTEVLLKKTLSTALERINPQIPLETITETITRLARPDSLDLIINNKAFHKLLLDGIDVKYKIDGELVDDKLFLIDFEDFDNKVNSFKAVNQFTIKGSKQLRRPDIVCFINGLPLFVIELKSPSREDADIWDAFNQLQVYKEEITDLFIFNEALVISDGVTARLGSLTANEERFTPWKAIKNELDKPKHEWQLETLVQGFFNQEMLLGSLSSNQSEIPALIQETGVAINRLLPSLKELLPVLQKFSDTVGDGRAQAQTLAKPVTFNKNEVSLAESLRGYKQAVLNDASFESLLQRASIFNNNNPVLLSNIKEWQSAVADSNNFSWDKELAFAVAMQSLEDTFKTCNQKPAELQEVLKLAKYIVNHSPVSKSQAIMYGNDTNEARLLQYAKEVRAVLSPAMSFTVPAVPLRSPNLDSLQIKGVRQTREQALKQLVFMCSYVSPAEQPISRENFLLAVEALKEGTFPDKISQFNRQSYEQKVIGSLREWDRANKAVDACSKKETLPYLRLRLELLTSMVLQEILESTSDNDMKQFKDKKGLLQVLDFMMKQPVNKAKINADFLPMFPRSGQHSFLAKLSGKGHQTPLDTPAARRLLSAFKDSGEKYQLSTLQSSVVQNLLNISRNTRAGQAGYLIQE
jgi:hypothetical protein